MMKATPCNALDALQALRLGSKVRCTAWAEDRYIEVVADKIVLNDIEANTKTGNLILQDFVLIDQWEILDYAADEE